MMNNKYKIVLIALAELIVFLLVTYIAYVTWSLPTLIIYVLFIILWEKRKLMYKKPSNEDSRKK